MHEPRDQLGGEVRRRLPRFDGREARLQKGTAPAIVACPGLAEQRRRLRQYQSPQSPRVIDGELQGGHAAHGMSEHVDMGEIEVIEQPCQSGREVVEVVLAQCRSAVTRHVPGDHLAPGRQRRQDAVEGVTVAADAVQQEQWRGPAGAGAFVGRQPVPGRHASSPCRTPRSTTTSPSRAMVQPRSGRSKCPRVCRPATSLAPVE